MTDQDFEQIKKFVYENTGIVLTNEKRSMVYSRLGRRLRQLHLSSFKDYCDLICGDKGSIEISNLINAITTNLTRFFREEHHFDHLKKEVLLPFSEHAKGLETSKRRYRIWSAGCSTGEEPYSLSMTVLNAIPSVHMWDVKILATDIDTNVLNKASEGHYKESKGIPSSYLQNYTDPSPDGSVNMRDSIKKLIHFKQLNLLEGWPMQGKFNVIFCRNVVIYFDKTTQAKLFDRFADALEMGGWLYIGHSESLYKISDRFELIGNTVYRKIR
jgi:chemotaxis protein methyltransferase CheR